MKRVILNVRLLFVGALMTGLFFASCGSRTGAGNSAEYRELAQQVNELDFVIENEWANPLRGQRINLLGNTNFIRFEGDSVEVHLPFFGVRHSGGGYGSEGAIRYEGPIQNLQIEEMPGRGRIKVSFTGNHRNENLDFDITIFSNGKTSTNVNSSQRDRMGYNGTIKEKA